MRGLGLKRGCEVICRQTVPALVTRIVALGTEVSRLSLIIHLRTVPTNKRYFGSVKVSGRRGKKDSMKIDSISHLLDIHLDRGVINEGAIVSLP